MHLETLQKLQRNIAQVIIGKEDVLELILVGLLSEGHILIDDVPGMGKTLLAKSLAASLACEFRRIQFTPDLTPTDVTGFFIYDRQKSDFTFRPGPIITNILLADELNRTVPRTQSSLLEAMEEKQITVDGQTFQLPRPFLVLATQNPVEQEGTFPLPEAQLDRFLLKIRMGYPSQEEEEQLVTLHGRQEPLGNLHAVFNSEDVIVWQKSCRTVTVHPALSSYMVSLVRRTREHPAIALGASPRATVGLFRASQARALLQGRDFVIPDDVKFLAQPLLGHRLILRREDRLRGLDPRRILEEILYELPTPIEEKEYA